MKLIYLKMAVVGVFLSFTTAANAGVLYGGDGQLHSIDSSTGLSSVIDSGDTAYRLGLAYNGLTDVMYSIGSFDGCLSTVNLTNGDTSAVGCGTGRLTGLTFSNDFNKLYSLDFNGGPLMEIDPLTGGTTLIGGGGNSMLDLSTDSSGSVYGGGFGGISLFDVTTGIATLIGGDRTWTAIAFNDNDVLFGVDLSGDALYTINILTGLSTLVGGDIGNDVRGLAFANSVEVDVPEPSTLGIFGLGLFGIGYRRFRKQ